MATRNPQFGIKEASFISHEHYPPHFQYIRKSLPHRPKATESTPSEQDLSMPHFDETHNISLQEDLPLGSPKQPSSPQDELGPTTVSSSTEIAEAEKSLQGELYRWCLVFTIIIQLFSFFKLAENIKSAGTIFTASVTEAMNILGFIGLWLYKRRGHSLFIPFAALHVSLLLSLVQQMLVLQTHGAKDEVLFSEQQHKLNFGGSMLLYFNHNSLFYKGLDCPRRQKQLLIVIMIEFLSLYITVMATDDFENISKEKLGTAYFKSVSILAIIIIISGMHTWITLATQRSADRIIKIQLEENSRYKAMFNVLRDPILLVKGDSVTFKNTLAMALLGSASENDIFIYELSILREVKTATVGYSLASLLALPREELQARTFTNQARAAKAPSMDQVQKLLEEEDSQIKFYQIKLIKVKDDASDLMIQIQDVSLRIQSQFLHVERQYMSIMNSTVSHEMRNPLNAIVSQIDRQRNNIKQLADFVDVRMPAEAKSHQFAKIKQDLEASLIVSESSTNLIRFNVEDLLALPQLKAGKFTKNLQEVDLRKGVSEVIGIMQHQASAKSVHIRTQFEGFPEADNDAIVLEMDLQRFQQVLLNFLSNALKFTERMGKISVLLQYVNPMSERERDLGVGSKDAQAEAAFNQTLQEFYGDHYLADSDSDDCVVEEPLEGFDGEDFCSVKTDKLPLEERFAFREKQRKQLSSLLTKERRPKILLSLMDSGLGIKVADQMKLFKLFGRLKSNQKVNTKGVGLGLSITKMISEEFGGAVAVHSKRGRGSTFQASLSLISDATNIMKKSKEEEELALKLGRIREVQASKVKLHLQLLKAGAALPAADKKVLVVDDEAYNTEVLKMILLSLGLAESQIVCCLSGKEALAALEESLSFRGKPITSFGLVFTDLSMPVMDGYRLACCLRKRMKKLHVSDPPTIVALTGHTESEFYLHAFSRGVDQVYSKPVCRETVKTCLLERGFRI